MFCQPCLHHIAPAAISVLNYLVDAARKKRDLSKDRASKTALWTLQYSHIYVTEWRLWNDLKR